MIVNIIGAGTWGVTLAYILNKNSIKTNVYCRNINTFNYIINNNSHPNLDKFKIPDNVNFTNSYDELNFQELTIIATSSNQVLSVLDKTAPLAQLVEQRTLNPLVRGSSP